jgi:hypothetical protein
MAKPPIRLYIHDISSVSQTAKTVAAQLAASEEWLRSMKFVFSISNTQEVQRWSRILTALTVS